MAQAPALMQFLIAVLAAWLVRQQEAFIEYLKAENRLLKARLGRRRIIFTDAERRLFARHAKVVGRKKLFALDPIVSPDTLLDWHLWSAIIRSGASGYLASACAVRKLNRR